MSARCGGKASERGLPDGSRPCMTCRRQTLCKTSAGQNATHWLQQTSSTPFVLAACARPKTALSTMYIEAEGPTAPPYGIDLSDSSSSTRQVPIAANPGWILLRAAHGPNALGLNAYSRYMMDSQRAMSESNSLVQREEASHFHQPGNELERQQHRQRLHVAATQQTATARFCHGNFRSAGHECGITTWQP